MSPELERLLEAYDQKLTCPLKEKPHRIATFERLLAELLLALELRYREFRRARRKPTTLPPRA